VNSSRRSKKTEQKQPSPIGWGVLCLIALFLCRLLVPTEATEQGLTLWLCAATFALAAVVFFGSFKFQSVISYRPALPDLAIGLMVLGHLVSGLHVLAGSGNGRSALNMMWEWLAIGVFWILMRLLVVRKESQQLLTNTFIVTVLGLSLLGLWQHYYWYPQQASKFEQLLEYTEQTAANEALSQDAKNEYKELVSQFGTDVLTLDTPGRMSFLARVKASVEPIGLFVLANTFALFLLVALLFVTFDFFNRANQLSLQTRVSMGLIATILLFCLILTKSRTAWAGTITGLSTYFVLHWILARSRIRISIRYLMVAISVAGGLILWGMLTGGLDPQVISEAPKSLQYRLEYWSSSLELLQDHPIFGAGPGNFRQHYLRYKLPGSSEEILDPHNLFLGIWSGGGLLALLGLCLLIISSVAKGIQNFQDNDEASVPPSHSALVLKQAALLIILGYAFTIASVFLLEGHLDQRLILMGSITASFSVVLNKLGVQFFMRRPVALAAFVATVVHLSGASGIEMPAVVLVILVLAHSITFSEIQTGKEIQLSEKSLLSASLMSLGLLVGSLLTGLIPVQLAQTDINIGKSMLLVRGNPQLAKRYFLSASEADSLSPEPQQQLALFYFQNWRNSGSRDDSEFEQAVSHLQDAIKLDPFAAGRYRSLGNLWDAKAEQSEDEADAIKAVDAYQDAALLYPNFAELQAELAMAQQRANQPATEAAKTALDLDELNHQYGHTDKFLSEDVRKRLKQMLR
jgi:O-antigen ligase